MSSESIKEARKRSEEYQTKEFTIKFREFLLEVIPENEELVLTVIRDILKSVLEERKGGKMLDFGCGPMISRVACASRYYRDIIMADYSDSNRIEVEKRLKNDGRCFDWKPVMDFIAKLEGYSDIKEGTKEIEKRIRSCVKEVIHCDILTDPPVPEEYGKFDLVFSSYCIENACTTNEMFKNSVKKLSNLIKTGGTLVMVNALNRNEYIIHKPLATLPVSETLIKESLYDCSLKLNKRNLFASNQKYDYSEYRGMVLFSAIKE